MLTLTYFTTLSYKCDLMGSTEIEYSWEPEASFKILTFFILGGGGGEGG